MPAWQTGERQMSKHKTTSPDETRALAKEFAKKIRAGDILALTGELGAGKTCFVQGLAAGLGVPAAAYVRSPSFILINEYRGGRLPLYHIDFYRLSKAKELGDLGLEEYIEGDGIAAIEWADRFPGALPKDTRFISFRIIDEETREIEIK